MSEGHADQGKKKKSVTQRASAEKGLSPQEMALRHIVDDDPKIFTDELMQPDGGGAVIMIEIDPKIDPDRPDSALLTLEQLRQRHEQVRLFLAREMGIRVISDWSQEHFEEQLKRCASKVDAIEESPTLYMHFILPDAEQRANTVRRNADGIVNDHARSQRVEREIDKIQAEYKEKAHQAFEKLTVAAEKADEKYRQSRRERQ